MFKRILIQERDVQMKRNLH